VLSPGVVVEAGAEVVDSVLLPGVVVRAGAKVRRAVLDGDVEVRAAAPSAATATSRWSPRVRP
jgi:glucose-1-phosphate adenylyltransferase